MAKSKKESELAPLPEPVATPPVVESEVAADVSSSSVVEEVGAAPIAPASEPVPAPMQHAMVIASFPTKSDADHFQAANLQRALDHFGWDTFIGRDLAVTIVAIAPKVPA